MTSRVRTSMEVSVTPMLNGVRDDKFINVCKILILI